MAEGEDTRCHFCARAFWECASPSPPLSLSLSLRSASEGPPRGCSSDEKNLSTVHAVTWLVACSTWVERGGLLWNALGGQCFLGNQYHSFSSLIAGNRGSCFGQFPRRPGALWHDIATICIPRKKHDDSSDVSMEKQRFGLLSFARLPREAARTE